MDELAEIFADLGFSVATGPEIEDDWHNFTALNIPETPSGAGDARHLLFPGRRRRAAQRCCCARTPRRCRSARCMDKTPPIRIIAPGRVYRSRQRRDAHADVPSGRGAGDRPAASTRPSQMDAGDLPQGLFRARRHRAAPAPVLFPLHRALGRGRCRLYAWRRAGACVGGDATRLDGSARQRHGPPAVSSRIAGSIPTNGRASPSAAASIGWRCSNTAWTICAPSSTATCAGCSITASRALDVPTLSGGGVGA